MAASRVGPARRRIVRSLAVLLGGVAGVVLGLTILMALARPAGAATLPLLSSGTSAPAISVPAVPVTGTQPLAPMASVTQAATSKVANISGAAASALGAGPLAKTAGPLATPVLAAGHAVVTPVMTELGPPPILLAGSSLFSVPVGVGASADPGSFALGSLPTVGTHDAIAGMTPISGPRAVAPGQGSGTPSPLPSTPAPNRAPLSPYPSPSSLLATNDLSDSSAGQGGSPFGTLPPPTLFLPVLALGGVLLMRGTRPRLLLDARCSPPG
jgi:hypothetical protein